MGRILERDAEMRKVISDIYTSILDMLRMKHFEKNLGSEMTKEYNGYIGTVQVYKEQMKRKHCPIVVAGGFISKDAMIRNIHLKGYSIYNYSSVAVEFHFQK